MTHRVLRAAAPLVFALGSLGVQAPAGPPPRAPSPCPQTPVSHELDFWIGSWTVAPWTTGPNTPPGAGGTKEAA